MFPLSERNVFLMLCTILMLLGTIFYVTIYQSQITEIQSRKQELQIKNEELIAVQNFMNAHVDMNAYRKDLLMQEEKLYVLLPRKIEQGGFIKFLQAQAAAQQIQISAIIPGKVTEKNSLFFLPIQVKLYGGYFQLLDFLEALENSDRFFVIRKLEIHSKDENLDCVLDMEIYAREA